MCRPSGYVIQILFMPRWAFILQTYIVNHKEHQLINCSDSDSVSITAEWAQHSLWNMKQVVTKSWTFTILESPWQWHEFHIPNQPRHQTDSVIGPGFSAYQRCSTKTPCWLSHWTRSLSLSVMFNQDTMLTQSLDQVSQPISDEFDFSNEPPWSHYQFVYICNFYSLSLPSCP